MSGRYRAGWVTRRNGAWLITAHDPTGDATPDDLYSAARALADAKRVLRQMAEHQGGFHGQARWTEAMPGLWELTYTHSDDDDAAAAPFDLTHPDEADGFPYEGDAVR